MSSSPGWDLEGEKEPKASVLGQGPETRVPVQGIDEEVLPGETGKEWVEQDRRASNQASQPCPDPVGSSGT